MCVCVCACTYAYLVQERQPAELAGREGAPPPRLLLLLPSPPETSAQARLAGGGPPFAADAGEEALREEVGGGLHGGSGVGGARARTRGGTGACKRDRESDKVTESEGRRQTCIFSFSTPVKEVQEGRREREGRRRNEAMELSDGSRNEAC